MSIHFTPKISLIEMGSGPKLFRLVRVHCTMNKGCGDGWWFDLCLYQSRVDV